MKVLVLVLYHQVNDDDGLGVEHLVLVSVLKKKKKSCSFSRLLLVILDGSDKAQRGVL